ncbi:MAG: isochorismatase family protein [Anaerolineales bacterium]|nr:isochorismatase family protein [Anaerolineales bacterium]
MKKLTAPLDPSLTALLIIDVQQGLFNRANPLYQAEELLANLNSLAEQARLAGALVVYIQHYNDGFLAKDTPNWRLHTDLHIQPDDPLIHKQHGNAFEKTELKAVLDQRGVSQLVIGGLVSHGCVSATTQGALDLGYRVILAQDGHSNFHKKAAKVVRECNEKLSAAGAELAACAEITFRA